VLLVALRYAPLFAQDDLDLLALLAEQSGLALDYDPLVQQLREVNQTLEQRVAERTANLAQAQDELRRSAGRAQWLGDFSRALAAAHLDYQVVLDIAARRISELLGGIGIVRLLGDDGIWVDPPGIFHPDPEVAARMQHMLASAPQRADEGLSSRVVATGQPLLIPAISPDQLRASTKPEYGPYLERLPIHSLLLVPLRARDHIIGLMSLGRVEPGRPYSADDQALLQEAADRAGLAILNAQLYAAVQRELAERKRAEAAVHAGEERYRSTLDTMLEGAQIIDFDFRYLYVNDAVVRQGREARDRLLGRTMMEVYPGIEKTEFFNVLQQCMVERIPRLMENEFTYPDGAKGWFELSIQPVPEGTFILSIDITDHKRAEEEIRQLNEVLEQRVIERTAQLQESEEKFSKAFRASPAGISIASAADGRYLDVNETLAQMTGYSREELIGRTSVELGMVDAAARARILEAASTHGFVRDVEIQVYTKSKQAIDMLVSTERIELSGKACMLTIQYDITERKRAEAEVRRLNQALEQRQGALETANTALSSEIAERRRTEKQFQTLLESTPDALVIVNAQGEIILTNPQTEKLFGYTGQELLGQAVEKLIPEQFRGKHPAYRMGFVADAHLRPMGFGMDLHGMRKDDSQFPVEISLSPLETEAGIIVIAAIRDVTERQREQAAIRQLNQDLQRHMAQLEVANQELEAFSYSVSHDLRAPLRTIDGFSLALLEDYGQRLDAEAQDYLRRVRAATQHMAQLIDDMLNLSRVSRAEMRREAVDLGSLAGAVAAELQKMQPERQVQFVIAGALNAHGDPRLLRVVLENLLANAWKFTGQQPQAQIEVGLDRQDGQVAYFVRDNGAGFDMAYANKLFGVFQRLHRVSEFPGTGVGLATVQRIIHRHGGRVWAEGAVGQGASFYFNLP
jgi:PAS domain S-box-containing protein